MRILLLVHPDFYDTEQHRELSEVREWIDRYGSALRALGHEVEKFHSRETRVRGFDWVHCFSSIEGETWVALSKAGCRVAVTPSLEPEPGIGFRRQASLPGQFVERGLVRLARAAMQKRWPPVDEASFASAAARFLVPSESWRPVLARAWRLDEKVISIFPESPESAARAAHEAFQA